jgi:hypothetical protein
MDRRLERGASVPGASIQEIIRACLIARYSDKDDMSDPLEDVIGSFDGPASTESTKPVRLTPQIVLRLRNGIWSWVQTPAWV